MPRDAADEQLSRQGASAQRSTLTTSNGTPVSSLTASMTAGASGPIVLQDFTLLDHLSHFDRERIPERVVHAKGELRFNMQTLIARRASTHTLISPSIIVSLSPPSFQAREPLDSSRSRAALVPSIARQSSCRTSGNAPLLRLDSLQWGGKAARRTRRETRAASPLNSILRRETGI